MPRQTRPGAEHRIPVNDDALFERFRKFALDRNMTWAEAITYLLDNAEGQGNPKAPTSGAHKEKLK